MSTPKKKAPAQRRSYAAACATKQTPLLKPLRKKVYITTKYGLVSKTDPNQDANELRRAYEEQFEENKYPTCARREDTVACTGGIMPCKNCGTYVVKLQLKPCFFEYFTHLSVGFYLFNYLSVQIFKLCFCVFDST